MLRQPIIAVLGHVDHGKTSLLDKIRGSATAAREAGGITQAIGASIIPKEVLQKICGNLLKNIQLTIPGLLFIDTPGHAAFTHLRKRGGNLADIAIVVIDINEGVMPQTKESIEILKFTKTPFIIAANKTDLIQGFRTLGKPLLQTIEQQDPKVAATLDTKLYQLVASLYELGFEAERFDRVSSYTKQVAIVPVSAITGDGIPELLMVIAGLSHKYLEQQLKTDVSGPAKGTILEIKEEKVGVVADAIIYDGSLSVGDNLIVGGVEEPLVTRVRGLFEPEPLTEIREKKLILKSVKKVHAAIGVRIIAANLENATAGMPFIATTETENAKKEVQSEVQEVTLELQNEGVIAKADSLGSLEALLYMLRENKIPVKRASIGKITKKDLSDAESDKNPNYAVVLAFNVPSIDSGKVINSPIIYEIIDKYKQWVESQQKKQELTELESLVSPCKIQILRGYIFRQSNPAVVGIEVLEGTLKTNTPVMKPDGQPVATVKAIQEEQENISNATKGKRVAISLPNVIIGRQLNEGETLFSQISEEHFRKYKEYKKHLRHDQKTALKEIAEIMRKQNPMWGI